MFTFVGKKATQELPSAKALRVEVEAITKRRRALMERALVGISSGGICVNHDVQLANVLECGCEGIVVVPMGAIFWTCIESDYEAQTVTIFSGWSTSDCCKHGRLAPILPSESPRDTLRQRGESLN